MAQQQIKLSTPQIFGIVSTTVSDLAAQVQTKVNTLNKNLVQPGIVSTTNLQRTPGAVLNGSIVVDPMQTAKDSQNLSEYSTSVRWTEMLEPS